MAYDMNAAELSRESAASSSDGGESAGSASTKNAGEEFMIENTVDAPAATAEAGDMAASDYSQRRTADIYMFLRTTGGKSQLWIPGTRI